ncbi:hypothetical protein GGI07_001496 [Coemansia sp. Benny D115]|nr:hypothetical protein GGI07_001496 [Coemansia sp. Benny D115]
MEDNALRTAVDIYGNRKWPMIADFVGTRTYMQCYQRWRVLQTPLSGVKSPITYWIHTAHQRLKLSKLMEASSGEKGRTSLIQRSEVIKALLKEQNDAIIAGQKLKSYNKLDGWAPGGRVLIESFSPQEDSRLLRLVKSYGDNWAFIAKVLSSALHADKTDPGDTRSKMSFRRNPETVKKRYSQLVAAFSGDIVSLGVDSIDKALTTADDSTSEQLLLIPPRIHRRSGNNKGKPLRRRHQWSAEETAKLKSVITQMINDENMFVSWKEVSRRMGEHQRSPAQCMSHWQQTCSDHIRREPFSKMEDRLLWPFVVSRSMRPLRSRNDPRFIGRTITAKYDRGEGREPSVIGFGWLSSGPMAGRTTYMVRARVLRLQQVVVWLRVVAKVEDAEKHFDLVRGLADSPCQFWNRPESLGAPS